MNQKQASVHCAMPFTLYSRAEARNGADASVYRLRGFAPSMTSRSGAVLS
jgi:hypothetical protein